MSDDAITQTAEPFVSAQDDRRIPGVPAGWRRVEAVGVATAPVTLAPTALVEANEVAMFAPPGRQERLRIAHRPALAGEGRWSALDMALLYLRPDDGRVSDRMVEPLPDGGVFATACLRASGGSSHYLWLVAKPAEDATRATATMWALEVPAICDGDSIGADLAAAVDATVRIVALSNDQTLSG